MPSVLIKGGLSLAIEEFIHKLNSQNIIKFKYKKVSEIPKFNKDLEIMLYRLVQEFINNSMKHSEAKNVSLLLDFSYNSELNLIIEDDGKGFDIDELDDRDDGRGVNNIKTKVLAFDGEHQLESAIGEGTKLTLKFKNPKLR